MPQRAYTARLRPYPEQAAALWHTHCAVNRGARAFGEALLTLRGGLPYTWVAEIPITEKRTQRPPTAEEQRWRRRLLSLCWLTVEDTRHAPGKFSILLSDVPAAFRQILVEQGVPESERQQWETDCLPALNARIRDDGTWVNRHAAFREFADAVRAEDAQFDAYAAMPAGDIPWNDPLNTLFYVFDGGDVTTQVLKGLAGVQDCTVAISDLNEGSVTNLDPALVLEYSHRVDKHGAHRIGGLQVPMGVYAREKNDYAELRKDICTSKTKLKDTIRTFKSQGFKVYANGR